MHRPASIRRAFSLVELLVVMSIIGLLLGIAVTSLTGADETERAMESRNHLRQIAQWIDGYAGSHSDKVVPSRFDYYDEQGGGPGVVAGALYYRDQGDTNSWIATNNPYVAASDPRDDGISQGSWADIIWHDANLTSNMNIEPRTQPGGMGGAGLTWGSDQWGAPQRWMYEDNENDLSNPLRSAAANVHNYPMFQANGQGTLDSRAARGQRAEPLDPEDRPIGLPTPRGGGAWERDLPGFFAANNFFDARSMRDITGMADDSAVDRTVTHAQVRSPDRSLYLIDSFRGEDIGGSPQADREDYKDQTEQAYHVSLVRDNGGQPATQEVDFRYGGHQRCLIMYLDGHVSSESRWRTLNDLTGSADQVGRGVRVMDLDLRNRAAPPIGP